MYAGPESAEELNTHTTMHTHTNCLLQLGGAPRDSAGSGAMEEGLTSRGGRHLRLPLRFGCLDESMSL